MDTVIEKIKFRFNILKRHLYPIPEIKKKRDVIDLYRKKFKPKTFIETGTFLGDTVEHFKFKFDLIFSIELSEILAKRAQNRFLKDTHITILEGNSKVILPVLLKDKNEMILFWLDGHYSSEFFHGNEYIQTAKGDTNTPIAEELDIILSTLKNVVILIDDARLFNGKNDYPTIKQLKQKVNKINNALHLFVKNDIIHIIPTI